MRYESLWIQGMVIFRFQIVAKQAHVLQNIRKPGASKVKLSGIRHVCCKAFGKTGVPFTATEASHLALSVPSSNALPRS